MKPYNQRKRIRGVVERWNKNYNDSYKKWPDKLEILEKLKALDLDKCNAKDVDDIIGNKTWTHFLCMECEDYKSSGVMLESDIVCLDCMQDALNLFKNNDTNCVTDVGGSE